MAGGKPAKITNCAKCGDLGKTRKTLGRNEYLCLKKCAVEHKVSRKMWLPIQDPKEARLAYEKSRMRNRTLKKLPCYTTMLVEFQSDCNSFTNIGQKYGRSRERIRQIYMRFFSAHIPRRPDGRTREKICLRKRRALVNTTTQNPAS